MSSGIHLPPFLSPTLALRLPLLCQASDSSACATYFQTIGGLYACPSLTLLRPFLCAKGEGKKRGVGG